MRLTGPMFSLTASGSLASTLTYSSWKGIAYGRQLVIPSNPQSSAQQIVRTVLGYLAKAVVAVLTIAKDVAASGSPFFLASVAVAPSGQTWSNHLINKCYMANSTIQSDYDALSGTIKGYFENGADDAGLVDYLPPFEGATAIPKAQQLFALAYFGANELTGIVQTHAIAAIAGANQGAIDTFVQDVITTD